MTLALTNLLDAFNALPAQDVIRFNKALSEDEFSSMRDITDMLKHVISSAERDTEFNKIRVELDEQYSEISVTDVAGRTMYLQLLKVLKNFEDKGAPAPTSVGMQSITWDLNAHKYVNDNRTIKRAARRMTLNFEWSDDRIIGKYDIVGIAAKRPFSAMWVEAASQEGRIADWLHGLMNPVKGKTKAAQDDEEE